MKTAFVFAVCLTSVVLGAPAVALDRLTALENFPVITGFHGISAGSSVAAQWPWTRLDWDSDLIGNQAFDHTTRLVLPVNVASAGRTANQQIMFDVEGLLLREEGVSRTINIYMIPIDPNNIPIGGVQCPDVSGYTAAGALLDVDNAFGTNVLRNIELCDSAGVGLGCGAGPPMRSDDIYFAAVSPNTPTSGTWQLSGDVIDDIMSHPRDNRFFGTRAKYVNRALMESDWLLCSQYMEQNMRVVLSFRIGCDADDDCWKDGDVTGSRQPRSRLCQFSNERTQHMAGRADRSCELERTCTMLPSESTISGLRGGMCTANNLLDEENQIKFCGLNPYYDARWKCCSSANHMVYPADIIPRREWVGGNLIQDSVGEAKWHCPCTPNADLFPNMACPSNTACCEYSRFESGASTPFRPRNWPTMWGRRDEAVGGLYVQAGVKRGQQADYINRIYRCYDTRTEACCDDASIYDPSTHQCCPIQGVTDVTTSCLCNDDADCAMPDRPASMRCCMQKAPAPVGRLQKDMCTRYKLFWGDDGNFVFPTNIDRGASDFYASLSNPALFPFTLLLGDVDATSENAQAISDWGCWGRCVDTSYQICCNGMACNGEFERCCNQTCCNKYTESCVQGPKPRLQNADYINSDDELGVYYDRCTAIESMDAYRLFWVMVLPAIMVAASLVSLVGMLWIILEAARRPFSWLEVFLLYLGAAQCVRPLLPFFWKYGIVVILAGLMAILAIASRMGMFRLLAVIVQLVAVLYLVDPFGGNAYLNMGSRRIANPAGHANLVPGDGSVFGSGLYYAVLGNNHGPVCVQHFDYFARDPALVDIRLEDPTNLVPTNAAEQRQFYGMVPYGFCSKSGYQVALLVLAALVVGVALIVLLLLFLYIARGIVAHKEGKEVIEDVDLDLAAQAALVAPPPQYAGQEMQ